MKWEVIFVSLLSALISIPAGYASAQSEPEIYLSSRVTYQGDLVLLRIKVSGDETVKATWMGKELFLTPKEKTEWVGFLTADLTSGPGNYKVVVRTVPAGYEKTWNIEVRRKDYGVRRLTLPKKMVDLDHKTLSRVKKESAVMRTLWTGPTLATLWRGGFRKPIQGDVVGPFGRKSVINDQPRSPHSGLDLKGKKGTPVHAVNNGKVVLTCDHFFSGRSVVIDHGGRILSMYFHLDRILVQQGDMVDRGHVIGRVGATGRATGPHLHWGVRVNGARVNPLSLISLSQQIGEW